MMGWFGFLRRILFFISFISCQCEGKITSPRIGKELFFLPGQTGRIKWEFNDAISSLRLRLWSFTSKDGSFNDIALASINRNDPTYIETSLFEVGIEKPATLVLNNVNQSYSGTYRFSLTSSQGSLSEVMVSIENAPNVTLSCPSVNKVNKGESFTCVCKDENISPPANVTWYKNGVKIGETKKENNALTLANVDVIHNGTYKCVAQSYPTDDFKDEKSLELIVLYKPYNTAITFIPQPAVVGKPAEILCDSEGFPEPHFIIMRDGKNISTGKSYTIGEIEKSDEGPYTCTALNALGNYSATKTLTVTAVKPNVTMTCPSLKEVNEGDDVICVCKGERFYPPANVTWYKNGVQIGETKKENNTLTITDVDVTDNGTYKCVAQSYPTDDFEDETSLELIVLLKPIATMTCPSLNEVNEGDDVMCVCKGEKSIALVVKCKTFLNDTSSGTEWYIVVVSLVSGIIIGIISSYIISCLHRRWCRNRKPENSEAQTTELDTTYQELDLTKMNAEDNYQSLRVNAKNNDAVNDDESTYTELNKSRDVENNYQSLS